MHMPSFGVHSFLGLIPFALVRERPYLCAPFYLAAPFRVSSEGARSQGLCLCGLGAQRQRAGHRPLRVLGLRAGARGGAPQGRAARQRRPLRAVGQRQDLLHE